MGTKAKTRLITDRWEITVSDLTDLIDANPSLRGMLLGYLGERKLREMWFTDNRVGDVKKYDDHDRRKKGDLSFVYKGVEVRAEVKSLQTNTVKKTADGWKASFQCDASDKRPVRLPNGQSVATTCLVVNEFDLLAVNMFQFGERWQFAFARNKDLPRTTSNRYTAVQQKYLLKTLMPITLPLQHPYRDEPFALLDEIAREKRGGS